MAECKFKVQKGSAGRYSRNCGEPAVHAITFTSWLDEHYTITTQMPLCAEHSKEKGEFFRECGMAYELKVLPK